MAETYSLALTGLRADSLFTAKLLTLPDSSARGGPGMARAMQLGTQLFCKGPDGSLDWYMLDAERSTPANPVLLKVS